MEVVYIVERLFGLASPLGDHFLFIMYFVRHISILINIVFCPSHTKFMTSEAFVVCLCIFILYTNAFVNFFWVMLTHRICQIII